ncbi:MAG: glycoside hydrolase family 125 protein [Bacteroidota bacterium]|nr:glycoside hydrolase family 125 protein [Bacteroidota bacterium]
MKHFLKVLKITFLFSALIVQTVLSQSFSEVRVGKSQRNFSSPAIEKEIQQMQQSIQDKELAWMFGNCFPNTLDRTVKFGKREGKNDTFVITGDIYAMWLRDCSAQVWPYLPFMREDKELQNLIQGVINRQVKCVLIDPYANAFNYGTEGSGWASDNTNMRPELHERKWEVDGLCYVIRLGYHYWKMTGDYSCFDNQWHKAMQTIVNTFKEQQRKNSKGPYRFTRKTNKASDTLFGDGYGNPVRPTGMICSMFRPSDDATTYAYLVPSNCFAVISLRQLAEMETAIRHDNAFAIECNTLANEVDHGIKRYAIVNHPTYGKIFAYEVDGYGNYLMMDDANVPSLLSLPYLGYLPATDKIYQNTRRFVWSLDNPYFYKGKAAEGIGGPHIGDNMIWPMSIIMRALTSNNEAEIADCLRMLKQTHSSTGFMHESFNKDKPEYYTRYWFAWSNTLFGELLIKIKEEHPTLQQRQY